MDVIGSHAARLPALDDRWTPRPYARDDLVEGLLAGAVAGLEVSHPLDNVLRNIRLLHEGDPDDQGTGVTYTITTAATGGTLFRDGNGNGVVDGGEPLSNSSTFTQDDIDQGRVKYLHGGGVDTGDSFTFESNRPHSWRNSAQSETVLIWINTPATF